MNTASVFYRGGDGQGCSGVDLVPDLICGLESTDPLRTFGRKNLFFAVGQYLLSRDFRLGMCKLRSVEKERSHSENIATVVAVIFGGIVKCPAQHTLKCHDLWLDHPFGG